MAHTTARHTPMDIPMNIPVDIESEDSVFQRLFSDEQKTHKVTKAERMARVFADAKTMEPDIKVSDFLPSY